MNASGKHIILAVTVLALAVIPPVAAGAAPADESLYLLVLLDSSSSMRASDPVNATQHAALTLLDLVAYDKPKVAVVEFSGQVKRVLGPVCLAPEGMESVRKVLAGRHADGTTLLLKALQDVRGEMTAVENRGARKAILVVSDGEIPVEQYEGLRATADALADAHVTVFAIGLGVKPGTGNILEELAVRTGGEFHSVTTSGDMAAGSCQAAIAVALRLLPNNIFKYTAPDADLPVPREAGRLLAVIPAGCTLRGPGAAGVSAGPVLADPSVRTSVSTYAGWQVIAAARPEDASQVDRFWEGSWVVLKGDGQRDKGWAFLHSDVAVRAGAIDHEPSAERHIRARCEVSRDALPGAGGGPYRLRAYLKPMSGVAYPAIGEDVAPPLPQTLEFELPPVLLPGDYSLVAQVLNPKGMVAAETRQPLAISACDFLLSLKVQQADGTERTLFQSGTGQKFSTPSLKGGETLTIVVEPKLANARQQIESLSGGITLTPRSGQPSTQKLEVDRSGKLPCLVIRGLRLRDTTLVKIDARGELTTSEEDPILKVTTRAEKNISAGWSFTLDTPEAAAAREPPGRVLATFVPPPLAQQGQPVTLAFDLTTSGGTSEERAEVLRLAADGAELVLTCPDGTVFRPSRASGSAAKRLGPIQYRDGESSIQAQWELPRLEQTGQYVADSALPGTALPKRKGQTASFISSPGRFEVTPAWFAFLLERTNRSRETLSLRPALTLADGDQVALVIRPTAALPPRMVEHVKISVTLRTSRQERLDLHASRVDREWRTAGVDLTAGTATIAARVEVPGAAPVEVTSDITVRPVRATIAIEGLDETRYPQDVVLMPRLAVTAEHSEDLAWLAAEQQLKVRVVDETGATVQTRILTMDERGRASAEISPPRPGRFQLVAALGNVAEAPGVTLDVTGPAVALRLLTAPPRVGDTSAILLQEPVVRGALAPRQALTPTLIPTPDFPVEHYEIVSASALLNGQKMEMRDDGLRRFYMADTWYPERDGLAEGQIEVRLTKVGGRGGMLLRQEIHEPIRIAWPWYDRYAWLMLTAAAVGAAALRAWRHYFALGRVSVSVVNPYLPEFDAVGSAQSTLASLLWPRLRLSVGAGTGDVSLPPEICNGQSGVLLTLRRNLGRSLVLDDRVRGESCVLQDEVTTVRIGRFTFQIVDPRRAAAPAGAADNRPESSNLLERKEA